MRAFFMTTYYSAKKNTWKRPPRFFYAEDGLISFKNCDFLDDPVFKASYERGQTAAGHDYGWKWRVHVGLWAASQAVRLHGDFIECGVNRGFLSSAVMHHLCWNQLNKRFYLLDTFCGLDEDQLSNKEKSTVGKLYAEAYPDCYEQVKKNFAEFKNVRIIRGSIPGSLSCVDTDYVSYLSIDMNCVQPEISTLSFFWDKLIKGAIVLFDDYGHRGHEMQKYAIDAFVQSKGTQVLSLPTGQGLLLI